MAKQFKVSQLQDEVSMYNEYVEIDVTAQGQDYIVKLYPYFAPTKIRDLVNELHEFFQAADKEKLTVAPIEEDDLVGYFICKYFTDMGFTKSKKAKAIYEEFKLAQNSKLFKVLLETYPKESVESVYERIYEVIEASAELENKFKQMQDMIKKLPLENREALEKLEKKVD